ncbi:ikaros family zinc finger protein-like [Asterias rubens]|uniref:ikaros family zinc finger protein-like n=1 Tax=Asterias rubens TaxID=7604 RepID=UPI0014552EEE|nr:ikaros family zinc finger protein-like [Asterias rubens]
MENLSTNKSECQTFFSSSKMQTNKVFGKKQIAPRKPGHLICSVCSKTFSYPSIMARHMKKHAMTTKTLLGNVKTSFSGKTKLLSQLGLQSNAEHSSENSELADNLHMPNPMQWLPPLEDGDNQSNSKASQECQPPNIVNPSDHAPVGKMTWPMNKHSEKIVIDLTSASSEVSTSFHHSEPSIAGLGDMQVGSNEQAYKQSQDQSETETKTKTSRNSKLPSGSTARNTASQSRTQEGHFTLCSSGKALKCNYCTFACRRTCGRMIKHLQIHGIRSRNQCKSCGLGFLNKSQLEEHQKMCSQASLAPQCIICGKTFSFRSLLRQHMNTHINRKPHKCKHCPLTFNSTTAARIHSQKHHCSPKQNVIYQCSLCSQRFSTNEALESHFRIHLIEKSFKCNMCGLNFCDASARYNHMRRVHKILDAEGLQSNDISWQPTHLSRPLVASPPQTSLPPLLSPVMTMPIVVSVTSQSNMDSLNPVDQPLSMRAKSVDGPSELTAGSPERIENRLDSSASGLVFMRKELNQDVRNNQPWSVSDSSDHLRSSEPLPEDVPNRSPVLPVMLLKKESEGQFSYDKKRHPSTSSIGKSSTCTRPANLVEEDGAAQVSHHQQFEPTSTADENDTSVPLEVYPVQYPHYVNANPARSNDNSQGHLLEISRVMGSSSPNGSYGRSGDESINPESPCRATSTRRSVDAPDALPGSHHCHYCDITFGDSVLHYLHMGWHVTGDPWKCNGCGQECAGKVDFFLHLYKAGHN